MKHKKIMILCSMILCLFFGIKSVYALSDSEVYSKFSPLTSDEKSTNNHVKTSVGTLNGGYFFETVTWDVIGTNSSTGKQKVRIRHYITHTGSSYIWQAIAVGISVDGTEVATFSSWVTDGTNSSKRISNKTQLCGEVTVELSPGTHKISLYDKTSGGLTVVNTTKSFNVPYIVKFVDYDGTVLVTRKVYSGKNATPPSNPTRTGYTFNGWSGTYTNITSNRTITATYKINTYTVKFVDYDGTVIKTQTVNHGSSASPPSNPTRTGYTFSGWSGSYSNVTGNVTITATYKINTYTVKFVDYDGTVLKTQTVNYGSNATPPSNPTRTGYTFNGWSGTYTNITSNRTITATYKINTYTVKFVDYDGTVLSTQSVNYGSKATKPTNPTRTGYTFVGWYTDKNYTKAFSFDTKVTSNLTLYAKYDKAPTIEADDIVILENMYTDDEWLEERIKKVTAIDEEDGDITSKIIVIKDTVDLSKNGTYEITYEVTDSAGNTVNKTITVTVGNELVEEETTTKRIRSISAEYINTLDTGSKWLIRDELNEMLSKTLNTPTVTQRWVLSAEDIEKIKEFNNTHGWSQESNQEFLEQFSYLIK